MQIRDSVTSTPTKYPKSHRHKRSNFDFFNKEEPNYCKVEIIDKPDDIVNKNDKLSIYKLRTHSSLKIILDNDIVGRLNHKFIDLYNVINNSKYILDFKDNWDENGSQGYLATTWIKAIRFLIKFYDWRDQNIFPLIKSPKIYQGPEGSIDIYWKNTSFTYLINIPEEESFATYFYKSSTGTKVEGEFDSLKVEFYELQQFFEKGFIV